MGVDERVAYLFYLIESQGSPKTITAPPVRSLQHSLLLPAPHRTLAGDVNVSASTSGKPRAELDAVRATVSAPPGRDQEGRGFDKLRSEANLFPDMT